ncbi:hypothetical protein JOD82_002167 [Paenibacillus sp. 1182]|nr:hypothetical protein [Paenibacillus sp. 1182]
MNKDVLQTAKMSIKVDSKLIIGINRSLNSRSESNAELCFELR